jgi:translation elongation factor EF-1alpha
MADKKIGKVSHYYDKIGVAVLNLEASLKQGDKIKFVRGDQEFEQTVDSMQIERKPIEQANKGDSIGLKTVQPIKPGAEVFLVG